MDRTEEWKSLLTLYNTSSNTSRASNVEVSDGLRLAAHIALNLDGNDALLGRMIKLTARKEFSNDPTAAIAEISGVFQVKMVAIQADLQQLKRMSDGRSQYTWSGQQRAHFRLVLDGLQKRAAAHLESFQSSVRTHSEHVESRRRRVVKYGGLGPGPGSSSSLSGPQQQAQFAMFAAPSSLGGDGGDVLGPGTRRRAGRGSTSTSSGPAQCQTLVQGERRSGSVVSDSRLRNAEKIESSIAQMGQLFVQMASLVKEQSSALARIEDDVEAGLMDTTEAHDSIVRLYEITKGNRSMILKIFALLVFFIFLFIVWT